MKNLTAVLLLSTALSGCSTYRFDIAECADIGLWDSTPLSCWCEHGDFDCAQIVTADSLYQRAWRHYHAHPHMDGGVVNPGPTHPTAALQAYAEGRDWRLSEMLAEPDWKSGDRGASRMAAQEMACAWECFAAPRGQRREVCGCR